MTNEQTELPSDGVHKRGITKKIILIATAVVLVAVGVTLGIVVPKSSTPPKQAAKSSNKTSNTFASFAPNICPLTDTPAPGGKDPRRPALLVKVGNEPSGARPQSGLNEADIVYDTPAEGGVMRYIAVFQCQEATQIGPVRSVRYVDWHIARQFIHPILAYANGIIPDVHAVQKSPWLESADLLTNAASASVRTTNREPPDNLYTSTSQLYPLYPGVDSPPPVFQYSSVKPTGAKSLSSVEINFSYDTVGVWKWNGSSWSHYYAYGSELSPDIDALTNQQVTTNNVVIQIVKYRYGPYEESPGSTGDVESETVGTGKGYILRNGTVTSVTWHRPSLVNPTTYTNTKGKPVMLTPGRTFVEMVLDTTAKKPGAITFTP